MGMISIMNKRRLASLGGSVPTYGYFAEKRTTACGIGVPTSFFLAELYELPLPGIPLSPTTAANPIQTYSSNPGTTPVADGYYVLADYTSTMDRSYRVLNGKIVNYTNCPKSGGGMTPP